MQERGVTDAPARLSTIATNVLEEVGLGNEVDDVKNVLGLVIEVIGALLIAERICIVLADMPLLRLGSEVLAS